MIKDKDVKFVDLRFTDPRGKMQHLTMDVSQMGEEAWEKVMFDGSSIAGWKAINEFDMVLLPDATSIHMDPFYAQTTMAVFCDIADPGTGEGYNRDPRSIANRTEKYLKSIKIGDTVFVGRKLNSSSSTMSSGPPHLTRLVLKLTAWNCPKTPTATMKPATWATDAHQGWLLPHEPDGHCTGHARRNALGHGGDGPDR